MSSINNNIFPLHHIMRHIQLNIRFSYLPILFRFLYFDVFHPTYLSRIKIRVHPYLFRFHRIVYIILESLKRIRPIKEKKDHCSYVRDLESDVRITVELNLVFISYKAVNVVHDREILPVTVETIWDRLCTSQRTEREFPLIPFLASDKCICSGTCTYC